MVAYKHMYIASVDIDKQNINYLISVCVGCLFVSGECSVYVAVALPSPHPFPPSHFILIVS